MKKEFEIDKDLKLVKRFVNNPDAFYGQFKERIRGKVYEIIEGEVANLNESRRKKKSGDKQKPIEISNDEKNSILRDFIDHILKKKNKDRGYNIYSWLYPKGYAIIDDDSEEDTYSVELSVNIPQNATPINRPTLDTWIETMRLYFQAKVIVNGILVKNTDILDAFIMGNKEPNLKELISQKIYDYRLKVSINDIAKDLAADLIYESAAYKTLLNFRFETPIITYFKDYVLRDYFKKFKDKFKGKGGKRIEYVDEYSDHDISLKIEVTDDTNEYKDLLKVIISIMRRENGKLAEVIELTLEKEYGMIGTDDEIAARMHITPNYVSTLRDRAFKRAREIAKEQKKHYL